MTEANKQVVRRLVAEVINAQRLEVLDAVCSPQLAPKLRRAFTEFRAAFPDWHQEIIELVGEGNTVVARFRCTGTQQGAWLGLPPHGGHMRIDEVYFFRFEAATIVGLWGRTRGPGSSNLGALMPCLANSARSPRCPPAGTEGVSTHQRICTSATGRCLRFGKETVHSCERRYDSRFPGPAKQEALVYAWDALIY
jgi:predicted ester cyclase